MLLHDVSIDNFLRLLIFALHVLLQGMLKHVCLKPQLQFHQIRYHLIVKQSLKNIYLQHFYHESYERYENGEMMSADSIHQTDTVKYLTPGGKIVYGGGGITPDVYVALERDSSLYFFNRLTNSGLIFQYAFDYADSKRSELLRFKDVKAFQNGFNMTDAMLAELYKLADDKGISKPAIVSTESRRHIKTLFKAYVARNILDDAGFYPVYQEIDPILLKAISHSKSTAKN